jgi:hypothetical protein
MLDDILTKFLHNPDGAMKSIFVLSYIHLHRPWLRWVFLKMGCLGSVGFSNVQLGFFWSSSTPASNSVLAWTVDSIYGYIRYKNKYSSFFHFVLSLRRDTGYGIVQIAKTGQTISYGTDDDGALQKGIGWSDPRFVDNGDGTITDTLTGILYWERQPSSAAKNWDTAITYANNLTLGGYDDWRLPNRWEMLSLADRSQTDGVAWLTAQGFSNLVASDSYWTSMTCAADTGYVWIVNLSSLGYSGTELKASSFYGWVVRGLD